MAARRLFRPNQKGDLSVGGIPPYMAWYPLFRDWLRDAHSPPEVDEGDVLAIQKLLRGIITKRFVAFGLNFYDTDVDDCIDEVFARMERRLARPTEYELKLVPRPAGQRFPVVLLAPRATHIDFGFTLDDSPARSGYKVRLCTATRLVWEEEIPAPLYDARSKTVRVHVPAKEVSNGLSYALEIDYRDDRGPRRVAGNEFQAVCVEVLHVLGNTPLTISGYHTDLKPLQKYRAEFHDISGAEIDGLPTISGLESSDGKCVLAPLAYGQLRHEQDTLIDLSLEECSDSAYLCCVRAVYHEALGSRRGFVVQVARTVATEHVRILSKVKEHKPAVRSTVDERKLHDAIILAKRYFEGLPQRIRTLVYEKEIEGLSWTEVAQRHNISVAKAKQDVSRAMAGAAEALLPGASKRVVQRFVEWVKETLDSLNSYQ